MSSTPKPKQNSSAGHGARVLTSLEAIALMEAKEKKKQDELEAKENRKKERIEKKQQREVEVKRKAEERERKAAARKQMAMEKEVEKKRKAELRLQKQIEKSSETSRTTRRSHANSQPSTSGITLEVCDQNMCSVCLGTYEDDFVSGVLQREWIRCTNLENCGLWMHCDCVSLEKNRYVCYMCNVVLK